VWPMQCYVCVVKPAFTTTTLGYVKELKAHTSDSDAMENVFLRQLFETDGRIQDK